jgi:hypothetical protein
MAPIRYTHPIVAQRLNVKGEIMSESRVEELLQEMPPKERRLCESDILQMGTQLKDEELLICARSGFPFGTLAVTLTRLIVFLQDGGVEVTPYSDVASFSLIEGKRRFLGATLIHS